ncbi:ankyrin repeat protein [Mucor ambiguus]|uniref:Ankyrin repeat protein n=1 Tax=Mucor ambiguus TaxID=91626 RepID=A0A0C9MUU9_9FUNG|nr:ankyrin repeat protein [Mucor ambiguus]
MFKYTKSHQRSQEQHHESLATRRASKITHGSAESITTARETHSSECRLLDLPIELLHSIFVYAQNPTLAVACRQFWSLGQSAMLRADYLMHRYGPTAVLGETAMRRHIVSLPTIHQLLRLNCDPTADDNWLFIKACELDQVDLCRQIVQVGHCSVVHLINLAAMKGSIGVVDLLVNEFGANAYNESVLALACRENQVKMVRHLVKTYSINVHSHSERHLRNACLHGFSELVEFLLDGADVHAYNDAAIQNASYKGFNDVVALLLDAGAHADTNQNACIQHAINNNDVDMVKCLIEKGGVDPRCNHDWPLRHSCRQGFNGVVEYLHRLIGTFNIANGALLELALVHDQLDTLKLLLKEGADPNCNGVLRGVKYAVNPKNKSRHKNEMIQSLLDAGFETNRQNESIFMMSDNKPVPSLIP